MQSVMVVQGEFDRFSSTGWQTLLFALSPLGDVFCLDVTFLKFVTNTLHIELRWELSHLPAHLVWVYRKNQIYLFTIIDNKKT